MKILVIHGPNLNLLGKREKSIYGTLTLSQINKEIEKVALSQKVKVDFYQSNHEGEIVTKIQEADDLYHGILINPAAFTHTSVAVRDAIASIQIPVVEVHLSNIHARESFRKESYVSPVAAGVIFGFGKESYLLGLRGLISILSSRKGKK
ncbi:MAG: type II 3-dehydroquinate dehydratase [Deltaproteobacteria bacterium]|nr:MAG: type II 3-dehydroquinate dehydratase [Deltaproteobacteria bacterium]